MVLIYISLLLKMLSIFSCIYWPLYIFFGEISVQTPCSFLKSVICFLLLICRNFLYILDASPLSDICFANIFSHFVGCIFHFLESSFEIQKLLVLMKSYLFIYLFILVVVLVSGLRNHSLIQS